MIGCTTFLLFLVAVVAVVFYQAIDYDLQGSERTPAFATELLVSLLVVAAFIPFLLDAVIYLKDRCGDYVWRLLH